MTKLIKNNLFSLNEKTLKNLISKTSPSCQNESPKDLNIGFGFFYYSLVRNFRPKTTLVLGSTKGFSPICFALGIKDNQNHGVLHFVDAGYSDKDDGLNKGMGGVGFWKKSTSVNKIFQEFSVEKIIKAHISKTNQFFNSIKNKDLNFDLIFIDADHSYKGFKYDFDNFSKLLNPKGIIMFHDVLVEDEHDNRHFGVKKYFEEKISTNPYFEYFRFPIWPGICIVRKTQIYETLKINKATKQKLIEYESILNKIYSSKTWKILGMYKKITKPLHVIQSLFQRNGIIDHLRKTDWKEFRNLRLRALKNEPHAFGDSYQERISQPDTFWQNRIFEVNKKNNLTVFAFKKGKLIGTAGTTQQNPKDKKNNSATICRVYVHPEYRGENTSIKLLNVLFQKLKHKGITNAHLFVSESQKAAIHIYKKMGFTTSQKSTMVLGDNQKHFGLIMKKTL